MKITAIIVMLIATLGVGFCLSSCSKQKTKQPCPNGWLYAKKHNHCCPAGRPIFCSYHKGMKQAAKCGPDTPAIRKDAIANCTSIEIAKPQK